LAAHALDVLRIATRCVTLLQNNPARYPRAQRKRQLFCSLCSDSCSEEDAACAAAAPGLLRARGRGLLGKTLVKTGNRKSTPRRARASLACAAARSLSALAAVPRNDRRHVRCPRAPPCSSCCRAGRHTPALLSDSYLVDPASSHMLVSKIKPCMSKYKHLYRETANGSLNQL
jgi:hypothetical protein